MWRTRRSLSPKSMRRPFSARRASGGTANTPCRSSGVSGSLFIVGPSRWILLRQGVIRRKVRARPRAPGGPPRGWIGPEGVMGGKTEGQERDRAQVEAARADVRLGEMRLVAGQTHLQPAVLVEGARRLQRAADDRGERSPRLRRAGALGQRLAQQRLREQVERAAAIGERPA